MLVLISPQVKQLNQEFVHLLSRFRSQKTVESRSPNSVLPACRWPTPVLRIGTSGWGQTVMVSIKNRASSTRFLISGLKVKWRMPIQGGYAGPAVADRKVFVFDYKIAAGTVANNPGKQNKLKGSEHLVAFDTASGVRERDCLCAERQRDRAVDLSKLPFEAVCRERGWLD